MGYGEKSKDAWEKAYLCRWLCVTGIQMKQQKKNKETCGVHPKESENDDTYPGDGKWEKMTFFIRSMQ